MVNKFANTKQTDDKEKRKICKHTELFVNTAIFNANIPNRSFYCMERRKILILVM